MTQAKFLVEIGEMNSNSFQRFMRLKGKWNGTQNGTYWGAVRFFMQRDKNEKEAKEAAKTHDREMKKKTKAEEKELMKSQAKLSTETSKLVNMESAGALAQVPMVHSSIAFAPAPVTLPMPTIFALPSVSRLSNLLNQLLLRLNQPLLLI